MVNGDGIKYQYLFWVLWRLKLFKVFKFILLFVSLFAILILIDKRIYFKYFFFICTEQNIWFVYNSSMSVHLYKGKSKPFALEGYNNLYRKIEVFKSSLCFPQVGRSGIFKSLELYFPRTSGISKALAAFFDEFFICYIVYLLVFTTELVTLI